MALREARRLKEEFKAAAKELGLDIGLQSMKKGPKLA